MAGNKCFWAHGSAAVRQGGDHPVEKAQADSTQMIKPFAATNKLVERDVGKAEQVSENKDYPGKVTPRNGGISQESGDSPYRREFSDLVVEGCYWELTSSRATIQSLGIFGIPVLCCGRST